MAGNLAGAEVPLVVRTYRTFGLPVIFRMHQNRIVLRRVEIQHRLQLLIFDLDKAQSLFHGFLIFSGHNGYRIANKTDSLIQNQAVVGAGLRISLARHREADIRHVFIGINGLDARHLQRRVDLDLLDEGMGIGASFYFYHKGIVRHHIIQEDRFSCHQGHGVLFHYRLIDYLHAPTSCFSFFHARYFFIARSWPS